MDAEFWLSVWERNNIMFHSAKTNPYLMKFWPRFDLPVGATVLVPLAGKSVDIIWLAEQGYRVIGVELSELAVRSFFVENDLTPTMTDDAPFSRWVAGDITMLCGDFFALTAEHMAPVTAVYDRAAMVALPAEMRLRYAQHMAEILPGGTQTFLITFDYDQTKIDGPPFAVADSEVQTVYQDHFEVEILEARDIISKASRFREQGLDQFMQVMYRLIRFA